jgi:RNA polymerase sigma factor (TIGR02999 family)
LLQTSNSDFVVSHYGDADGAVDIIQVVSEVTQLLVAIEQGDPRAAEELFPMVYEVLHRLARKHMAQERKDHTLQATALVSEAYLRLVGSAGDDWDSLRHFLSAAAEAMRRILIEYARSKNAAKRGGGIHKADMADVLPVALPCENLDELLELDSALVQFAQEDPTKAELVKLLYFAGLNLEEAAAVQGISRTTAYRRWLYARAWLRDAVSGKALRAAKENEEQSAGGFRIDTM